MGRAGISDDDAATVEIERLPNMEQLNLPGMENLDPSTDSSPTPTVNSPKTNSPSALTSIKIAGHNLLVRQLREDAYSPDGIALPDNVAGRLLDNQATIVKTGESATCTSSDPNDHPHDREGRPQSHPDWKPGVKVYITSHHGTRLGIKGADDLLVIPPEAILAWEIECPSQN